MTPVRQMVSPLESVTITCNHSKVVQWIFKSQLTGLMFQAMNHSLKKSAVNISSEGSYYCMEYRPTGLIPLALSLILTKSKRYTWI